MRMWEWVNKYLHKLFIAWFSITVQMAIFSLRTVADTSVSWNDDSYQVIMIVYARWKFQNATGRFNLCFLFFFLQRFIYVPPQIQVLWGWDVEIEVADLSTREAIILISFKIGARYCVGIWPFWTSVANWATIFWTCSVFPYSYALIFRIKQIQNPSKQDLCLCILNGK